jgi:hypothetical protein
LKFDVVVGNPPYQDNSGHTGKGHALWINFIRKAFDILKDGGYLVYVHPSLWRQEGDSEGISSEMKKRNILHLDIHGIKDGISTFGATTRYDWYVMRNEPSPGKTVVRGEDGEVVIIDLREWSFVPNMKFDIIKNLIAKDGEERVTILHSRSKYGTDKKNMAREPTAEFKYPCVYYIPKNKEPSFRYSNIDSGWFSIPKVIFCSGVYKSVDVIADKDGQYAMTEFCFGMAEDAKNIDNIKKAVRSEKFISVVESFCISKTEINRKVVRLFRKDFWKDFI